MTTITIDRAVVEQALEVLEMSRRFVYADNRPQCDDAIDALRTALAQQADPVQEPVEPVAWECQEHGDSEWFDCGKESYGINPRRYTYRALYTAPPQRKPLTEEQISALLMQVTEQRLGAQAFARAIERAHGIKE